MKVDLLKLKNESLINGNHNFKLHNGLINGNGLTNGNGFTNGSTSRRTIRNGLTNGTGTKAPTR